MRTQLIKSTLFFQQLLSSRFRILKERVVKTIMLLSLNTTSTFRKKADVVYSQRTFS